MVDAASSAADCWLKAHNLHFVLSLHKGQTTDGEKTAGSALTTLSTALGMETFKAHARRRTVTVARFENCGVYMVYPLIVIYPPIAKDRRTGGKTPDPKTAPFI
jgi:hypothetical protein